jgi:ribosome maturation factor RimP
MPNAKVLSKELFHSVQKDVVKYIRKKLRGMEMDVTYLELHNSSFDKTLRVYVTLSRTTNLKALYLAERMVCKELQDEFGLAPDAIYWRYVPEAKDADDHATSTSSHT